MYTNSRVYAYAHTLPHRLRLPTFAARVIQRRARGMFGREFTSILREEQRLAAIALEVIICTCVLVKQVKYLRPTIVSLLLARGAAFLRYSFGCYEYKSTNTDTLLVQKCKDRFRIARRGAFRSYCFCFGDYWYKSTNTDAC
jgi:hypothetical protein